MRRNTKVLLGVLGIGGVVAGAYYLLSPAVWGQPTKPPAKGGGGGGGGGGKTGGINPAITIVGIADNGGSTTLNVGDTLVVALAEDPSTGATWSLSISGAPLKTSIPDVVVPAVPPELPAHTFTMLAVQPGSATLVATQTAPDGTAIGTWRYDVTVTGTILAGGGGGVHGGGSPVVGGAKNVVLQAQNAQGRAVVGGGVSVVSGHVGK